MDKWYRMNQRPMKMLGENNTPITGCKEHIALSHQVATEGMVLLKNEGGILPLQAGSRVALFGKATIDYVKGGWGSGRVMAAHVPTFADAMEAKEEAGYLSVFRPLNTYYRGEVDAQYQVIEREPGQPGLAKETTLPDGLLQDAAAAADVAIISLCRCSSENSDRPIEPGDGDFYLSAHEQMLVEEVTSAFDKVVVVLNIGSPIDMTWCADNDKIGAILCAWQGGNEGALAQADILCGDVCPSGKLTDTLAYTYADYPSSENYNVSDDTVEYTEDIFVGYRYFETIPGAADKVAYPFGFGLSYTTFAVEATGAVAEDTVTVTATVTNTGSVAGKEVVQVYATAPKGDIDKPACELRGYAKTPLLQPGESCTLTIAFPVAEMASYDEGRAAYVLEAGDYIVTAGTSVRDRKPVLTYTLEETKVTRQLTNYCKPHKLSKRMTSTGEYVPCQVEDNVPYPDMTGWTKSLHWQYEHDELFKDDPKRPDLRTMQSEEGRLLLKQVAAGEVSMEEFMAQLSLQELIVLIAGTYGGTSGVGDLPYFGIPAARCADGPAGLNIPFPTTAFPCATLQGCTWNPELITRVGEAAAEETKENNYAIWLAPGMNIHRNPKCGRNFEYYSEDPLVAGRSAAALVRGCQSRGISASIKHLCCNNKEQNRYESDSILSERALREIYLKGFEIAVRESDPWTIMTSYNRLNGWYVSENREILTGIVREEWGYNGLIITDWACRGEPFLEALAGNNVHMPFGIPEHICRALEAGYLTREDLERNVRYLLEFLLKLA